MRIACRSLLWLAAPACLAQVITTVAGTDWLFPADGLPAVNAPLGRPEAIAVDRSGNLYVADSENHMVLKIGTNGIVRVIGGNGTTSISGDGGLAVSAGIPFPQGVTVDGRGNVYVSGANRIRQITPDGIIHPYAGTGSSFASGDGGPAASAALGAGRMVADAQGNLYVSDTFNHQIRKITPDGIISTVAGKGGAGYSGEGGPAVNASLNFPSELAIDSVGNLYVADANNFRVRKIAGDGVIRTVVGNGNISNAPAEGVRAVDAAIGYAYGVAVDSSDNLLVPDSSRHTVHKVTPDGIMTTIIGSGSGGVPGAGGTSLLNTYLDYPYHVAVGPQGEIYVSDLTIKRIWKATAGVVFLLAGNGKFRLAGEGGPATSATLFTPDGVAVDAKGNLYIAENQGNRLRRVSADGGVRVAIGSGSLYGPVEGPALDIPIPNPTGVVFDAAGNLYFSNSGYSLVQRLRTDNTVVNVAGTFGPPGPPGDGGVATKTALLGPTGLAFDAGGNLYIAEARNHRVRKVTPDGLIFSVAGNGQAGFSGDGGPAASASLNSPQGLAIDGAGNLYIADGGNRRIRKVSNGVISTYAGNGQAGYSGDGGPAASARLNPAISTTTYFWGLAVDSSGQLYIADYFNNVVRKVSANGIITTVAGNGRSGFSGDGGPALKASLSGPSGLAVDVSGRLYISEYGNHRVRVLLVNQPTFARSPATLSFTAPAGGSPPSEQTLQLSSSVAGLPFSVQTVIATGGTWLKAGIVNGAMPAGVAISVDPTALTPGVYQGSVVITAPDSSTEPQTVLVTFTVTPGTNARPGAQPRTLSFAYGARSSAFTRSLAVSNLGGGTLSFSVSAQTNGGGSWLSATPASGSATPSASAPVAVTADPAGLDPGTYTGRVTVASAAGNLDVPVIMTVSAVEQSVILSTSGLTFTGVVGGGVIPSQSFTVLRGGASALNWTVDALVLSGGRDWLSVAPSSGTASPTSDTVVKVDQFGLAAGEYYGQVRVTSTTAANSPQFLSVVLNLLPAGSNPGPVVQPAGLLFTGEAGGPTPGSQTLLVSNLTAAGITYSSGAVTVDGAPWFMQLPAAGNIAPDQPVRILVQPDLSGLSPGVRQGVLTLGFSDGSVRTVKLVLVVASASSSLSSLGSQANSRYSAARLAGGSCAPTRLVPLITSLGAYFNVSAGWPVPLAVRVVDDCGTPMVSGSVNVSFSNGDPVVPLLPLADGRWSGMWQARATGTPQVTITASAEVPDQNLRGTAQVTGGLQGVGGLPVIGAGAIVSAASLALDAPLAPGGIITIFGAKLAEGQAQSPAYPLEQQLAGTLVTLAGKPLPLFFAGEGQVNAVVPFDVPLNTSQQLLVRRGNSISLPEPVTVASVQPAIFTRDQSGGGQGVIVDVRNQYVDAGNPARAGDVVVIYCSGLGAVNPAATAGVAAPLDRLLQTSNQVSVTIGGVQARVQFAGMAPGSSGLYQVNAVLPEGVAAGNRVPVVLTQAGQASPPVTIGVR